MFPSAQTACSATLLYLDKRSLMKGGTAPEFTTVFVCPELPEATLVRAHAASNCRSGLKNYIYIKFKTILFLTTENVE